MQFQIKIHQIILVKREKFNDLEKELYSAKNSTDILKIIDRYHLELSYFLPRITSTH